ncbi:MAG TPA: FAD-dependent oxidoreductase, partial [Deferrisomatales bacterium]|nr:FAD-dependent oxidoreductase [Deferrisomatales bacterium]
MHTADRRVLLGNEAIARGLVEAGCQFITAYPGTPSSEILPGVVGYKEELGLDLYAEWSTNEKVALETALAAAYSGKRTAVVMKQVGLNVAADPALSAAYIGVVGGLVLVVADDPGPHSSQTEQDTRLFATFAKIPTLDPTTPQEAKDMVALAFELSERHQIPVILRPTTRLCHAKQTIDCGPVKSLDRPARFVKNPRRWAATPKARFQLHTLLNEKLAAIEGEFETWASNRLDLPDGELKLGIVASGVSHAYLADLLPPLGLEGRVGILKLTTAYPLPQGLVGALRARCGTLLVLEEPDTAVEGQVRGDGPVWGRFTGHVPPQGELTPEVIETIVSDAARGVGLEPHSLGDRALHDAVAALELPIRRPALCPGCGHRSVFYALRRAYPQAIFPGDIGCYTLGLNLGSVDTVHDMGASISMAAGFYHAYAQDPEGPPPIFATIGDGTFYHSGVAGLENAIYNGARFVLLILDNEVVGMTGMQPTPEHGATVDGHPGRPVHLETLVRGCGVEYLVEADPFDADRFLVILREALEHTRQPDGGVAVIIGRYACVTRMKGLGPGQQPVPVEVCHDPVPRAPGCPTPLDANWLPRHEDKISPCAEACPAGNDIERLMALGGEKRFAEAAAVLYEEHPFPSTLGRVCGHPCERSCNRGEYDGAVSIRHLERAAGDAARSAAGSVGPGERRGSAVAVIGAGPAGLTAAYHLARLGYPVEVFEAQPEAGGMLRWAIPEYRLPASVLERELAVFTDLGVELHTGVKIGQDLPWAELSRFAAVCVATGAWRERRLGIPGEDQAGVLSGLAFLAQVRRGQPPEIGRRVAVIGGGNTAIDSARTARRLGAEVTVYYRRAVERMRAIPEEVEAARAEGIFFRFRAMPTAVKGGNNRKLALQLRETRMEEAQVFALGREGSEPATEFWSEVDTVVVAVGAEADLGFLGAPEVAANGALPSDPWGRTELARVFCAGDAGSGDGTVAGAINTGKRAALAIHGELSGEVPDPRNLRLVRGPGITAEVFHRNGASPRSRRVQATPPARTINLRHFPEVPRNRSRALPPDEAIWSFAEVEAGLSPEQAAAEARRRCYNCGVCTHCDVCQDTCPTGAISQADGNYRVDLAKCTACRLCQVECPRSAITMPETHACVSCGYCTSLFECPALIRQPDGLAEIDRKICV